MKFFIKMFLSTIIICLTLVSCDLFNKVDSIESGSIQGTWRMETTIYEVDDFIYVADYTVFNKAIYLLEIDENTFTAYSYSTDSKKYVIEISKTYTKSGDTIIIDGFAYEIFVKNSILYLIEKSEDESDMDEDGILTDELTITYSYVNDTTTDLSNTIVYSDDD